MKALKEFISNQIQNLKLDELYFLEDDICKLTCFSYVASTRCIPGSGNHTSITGIVFLQSKAK